ncbi:hypothetical protein AAFF_G00234060 [Aldrovandia affinis]|uniref:Signal-induced proliferation-associated 1-like protein 2 n=1 Tax=Aldrovandia affinis TaxID=143900 RepID=A0AAD7REP8_9TELE|nr:hypothetical protein AAFF_G00234060 [Aldrovandia affinis]
MRRFRSESSETSLFRKLRAIKSEGDGGFRLPEPEERRPPSFHKCFAHYDVQSVLFNIGEAVANRANLGRRKNTTTGASAASHREDLNSKENLDTDEGDGKSSTLVLSCPYFRNEIGGEGERRISLSRANAGGGPGGGGGGGGGAESCSFESSLSSHCTNAGVSVLEVPRESQPIHREKVKRYIIEHIDLGAYYYHKYFYNREHQNYFGVDENLGPVAVSVRREKLDEGKEKEGAQYNYRVTFRTSELTTLRGAILEDAVPSTAKHGVARGLPLKEVLEYVVPELNIPCLRLALNSPKVPEQLLKLDEQGLSFQHKVGILYCRAEQSTEEEMYNNESAGPAFQEFLELLGQRVRLKGFTKYRAQLDNKTDSTGTHSLYTTYKDYELMFHVSTLLPYTPNNRQQLLRKRHIGNDIVTIVFQEPGALPFTPKNIRSHFQHVFVIVKVHNPCTGERLLQRRGGVTFPKSAVFRDFLLAKVINGENAAHKSEKFRAMATRTRQEYLRDLAENFVGTATVDSAVKFSFITLGAKRRERSKPRRDAHLQSVGAVTWSVVARDFGQAADVECLLGVSNEFIVLIEEDSKNVVFNCSCRDVIGWTSGLVTAKVFYERGECVVFSAQDSGGDDIREIVQRLEIVTRGCETSEMTLRRNALGQLGFHVNFEGIVADVEPYGFAWKAGLRQGSRLVEICKVAVATLTHEQMIDLLRTSVTVKVVIIQPHEDGTPRRGCSELYRIPMVEYKLDSEGTPCEYKTPFRRNTTWHRAPERLQQSPLPRSTSFDRKLQDGPRVLQDLEGPQIPPCTKGDPSQHYRSSPSNQSSSSDPGPCGSSAWAQQAAYEGCQSPVLHERSAETKWHIPSTKILNTLKDRGQKDGGKDSPNKLARAGEKGCPSHCSSHSSSNTLSSNASSNSDEKHFCSDDLLEPDLLTYVKGASTDSGIDTAPCMAPPPHGVGVAAGRAGGLQGRGGEQLVLGWAPGEQEEGGGAQYLSTMADGSIGDLSELSSHSSGSHHSGSPSGRSCKTSVSLDSSKVYIVTQTPPGPGPDPRPCSRHPPTNKYLIGWKKAEDGPPMDEPGRLAECGRLYAPDAPQASRAGGRCRLPWACLHGDLCTAPCRMRHPASRTSLSQGCNSLRSEIWYSDGSLADKPGLMPLPDTGSGLDWSHLVDAARAFEGLELDEDPGPLGQRVSSFCSVTDLQQAQAQALALSQELSRRVAAAEDAALEAGEGSGSLTGKVNQLEVILRQLQYDLRKEKEDKAMLQEQVQHLRQDNMRLHEESQTAAAQLRKFTEWFFHSIDKKP